MINGLLRRFISPIKYVENDVSYTLYEHLVAIDEPYIDIQVEQIGGNVNYKYNSTYGDFMNLVEARIDVYTGIVRYRRREIETL